MFRLFYLFCNCCKVMLSIVKYFVYGMLFILAKLLHVLYEKKLVKTLTGLSCYDSCCESSMHAIYVRTLHVLLHITIVYYRTLCYSFLLLLIPCSIFVFFLCTKLHISNYGKLCIYTCIQLTKKKGK